MNYFKCFLLTVFLSGLYIPVRSNNIQPGDSLPDKNKNQQADSLLDKVRQFTAEEIVRGERLFYGLVYPQAKSANCAGCHNTRESDSLNWNPDALEISLKYRHKSARDLSRAILSPTGPKMAEVHKNTQLTPEDIILLKAYMDEFTTIGLKPNKPVITNLLLFIIASILFLFSATDLIITKTVKKQWILTLILAITGSFITWTLVVTGIEIGRSKDYTPEQPIKFSHKVHAGQNKTDCLYCHSSAPYSKAAGVPASKLCMNCHLLVRNGTRSGTYEIAKIIAAVDSVKPIEWIKVHNLPDHVFFSHAQHVGAGKVSCQKCHGEVEEMHVLSQVSDLSMGWCINCHRTTKVDFQNNNFYSDYKDLIDKIKSREIDSVTVDMLGGIECMKCHY